MNKLLIITAILFVPSLLLADKVWVGGQTHEGQVKYKNGRIEIKTDAGATVKVDVSQVQNISTKRPSSVRSLEKATPADIIKKAPALLKDPEIKMLAWSKHVGYLLARAYMSQGKFQQAIDAVKNVQFDMNRAPEDAIVDKTKLASILIAGYARTKRLREADTEFKKIKVRGSSVDSYTFYASGEIMEAKGKKTEALLEYFKSIYFPGSKKSLGRRDAISRVVVIYKGLGDARADKFASMK